MVELKYPKTMTLDYLHLYIVNWANVTARHVNSSHCGLVLSQLSHCSDDLQLDSTENKWFETRDFDLKTFDVTWDMMASMTFVCSFVLEVCIQYFKSNMEGVFF